MTHVNDVRALIPMRVIAGKMVCPECEEMAVVHQLVATTIVGHATETGEWAVQGDDWHSIFACLRHALTPWAAFARTVDLSLRDGFVYEEMARERRFTFGAFHENWLDF